MDNIPLSVVVLAKNEEKNIGPCLDSVRGWADELIVIDDESDDTTVEIARRYTEKVWIRKMLNEGAHRNRAYQECSHAWVLSLDADEVLSRELKEEITGAISQGEYQAFAIPVRTYVGGYWVRYGGWYPASKIKLFRKEAFRYEEVLVHPRAFVEGKAGRLQNDLIQHYRDFEYMIASLNRQTSLEARKWISQDVKMPLGRIIRRTVDRFFRSYVRKRGCKDGYVGFMIAFLASAYQIVSYVKYRQMKEKETELVNSE